MENDSLDCLLHDATQQADPGRRDRALMQLLAYAERAASSKNPGHAESVAASAVAMLHRKIASRELRFETPGQLLAFLRQVAWGKAVDRIRKDDRDLGQRVGPGQDEEKDPPPELAADGTGVPTLAADEELHGYVRNWLARLPASMRSSAAEHIAGIVSRLEPDERLPAMTGLEAKLDDMARSVERVLEVFPEVLRSRAAVRIGRTPLADLPCLLVGIERMMAGARGLSRQHRLAVEMREAGWEPKEISERLGLSAGNVRVIHHRLAARLLGREEADEGDGGV